MKKIDLLIETVNRRMTMLTETTAQPTQDQLDTVFAAALVEVLGFELANEITMMEIVPVEGSEEADITFEGSERAVAAFEEEVGDASLHRQAH
jgi:hypothetical protein